MSACPDCGLDLEIDLVPAPMTHLLHTVDHMAGRIERIHTVMTQLDDDLAALTDVVTQTVTAEQGLEAQVADLQAKLTAGDTQGAALAASQIEKLTANLKAALPAQPDATPAGVIVDPETDDLPAPPAAPAAPVDPSTVPAGLISEDGESDLDPASAPVAGASGLPTVATPQGDGTTTISTPASVDPTVEPGTAAAVPPAEGVPVADSATATVTGDGTGTALPPVEVPLYTHDGDTEIDTAVWPRADVETEDGRPLYTFTGDTAGQPGTGDGLDGTWHLYTGETRPVEAPPAS